jgi:hypothetical protein
MSAPIGWKLVPCEPTDQMIDFACPVGETVDHFSIRTAIREAIAAAPTQGADARPVASGLDYCTEENCSRCNTPKALRTEKQYHAGIGKYPWDEVTRDAAPSVTQAMVWGAYNMCPDHVQGQPARMRWMAEFINAAIAASAPRETS